MLNLKIEANSFNVLFDFVTDKNVSIICDLIDEYQHIFKHLKSNHPLRFIYALHRDKEVNIKDDEFHFLIDHLSKQVPLCEKFESSKQMLLKLMEKVPDSLGLVRELILSSPERFNDQGSLAIIEKVTEEKAFSDEDLNSIFKSLSRSDEFPTLFLKKFPERREFLFMHALSFKNVNLIIALLKEKGLNKEKIDGAARNLHSAYSAYSAYYSSVSYTDMISNFVIQLYSSIASTPKIMDEFLNLLPEQSKNTLMKWFGLVP